MGSRWRREVIWQTYSTDFEDGLARSLDVDERVDGQYTIVVSRLCGLVWQHP